MKKTYAGSCHCSICTKDRKWLTAVKPEAFRLLAGEPELGDYQFGAGRRNDNFRSPPKETRYL